MLDNKYCLQCDEPVVPGEHYCAKCIYDDAVTMGVIDEEYEETK